jgi:hypothetical protein
MLSLRETQTETRAAKSVRKQSKIGFFFEEAEDVQLKSPQERTDLEQAFSGDDELSPRAEPPGEQARCHVLSFGSHIPLFWPFAHLAFLKPFSLLLLISAGVAPPLSFPGDTQAAPVQTKRPEPVPPLRLSGW